MLIPILLVIIGVSLLAFDLPLPYSGFIGTGLLFGGIAANLSLKWYPIRQTLFGVYLTGATLIVVFFWGVVIPEMESYRTMGQFYNHNIHFSKYQEIALYPPKIYTSHVYYMDPTKPIELLTEQKDVLAFLQSKEKRGLVTTLRDGVKIMKNCPQKDYSIYYYLPNYRHHQWNKRPLKRQYVLLSNWPLR